MPNKRLYIGTAGWSIPKAAAEEFPPNGSHLERYAQRFPCAEINSSFYRPHRPATYERWASSVPADFRFTVKVPRTITHSHQWGTVRNNMISFLDGCSHLGSTLGPLLFQFPPRLAFNPGAIEPFLETVRALFQGDIVMEPRHASWFTETVEALLQEYRVSRVAADPATVPQAGTPGGRSRLRYYRLHGSPQIYYSHYSTDYLRTLATTIEADLETGATVWCIFDNTAEGAATANALMLMDMMKR